MLIEVTYDSGGYASIRVTSGENDTPDSIKAAVTSLKELLPKESNPASPSRKR